MKILVSGLALGLAIAFAPAADAAVCTHGGAHCRMAFYGHHHYRHYGYRGGVYPYPYPAPAGYAPAYYGYVPGYFYATPAVSNPGFAYGPYPYSWGYRNTLNLLLNNENDPPFAE